MRNLLGSSSLPLCIAIAIFAYIRDQPYIAVASLVLATISVSKLVVERMEKNGRHPREILGATLLSGAFIILAYIAIVVVLVVGQHYILVAILTPIAMISAIATTVEILAAIGKAQASEQPSG